VRSAQTHGVRGLPWAKPRKCAGLAWSGPSGTRPTHTQRARRGPPWREHVQSTWCSMARNGSPMVDRWQGVHCEHLWLVAQLPDMARSTISWRGGRQWWGGSSLARKKCDGAPAGKVPVRWVGKQLWGSVELRTCNEGRG
jgi:hypothetical protein